MLNENLIELSELMHLLGYSDERSIRKWCKGNSIPILKLGLKKYVLSHLLTQYIDNQCVIFVKGKNKIANKEPKQELNTSKSAQRTYYPNNELISKYLTKYESASKNNTTKKTAS